MTNYLKEWYSLQPILTRGAIMNFILGGRNIGKTWALKRRTWRRHVKKGKRCIWIRRTKAEAIQCAESFYTSADLRKFCGLTLYDPNTKKGECRHNGRSIERRVGNKWEWVVKVVALSEFKNMRSVDDVDCDTIIFDEFTTTPEKYIRYQGNEAQDFIDIIVSVMRQHAVRVFLSGNKESVYNPIYNYFKLPVIPLTWLGIRTHKNGTIAVQQVGDREMTNDFQSRFATMIDGTAYGAYMKGAYKNQANIKVMPVPDNAQGYMQVVMKGKPLAIKRIPNAALNAPRFIISHKIRELDLVFTDTQESRYRCQKTLVKRLHTQYFREFIQAASDNRIAYERYDLYEAAIPLFRWLNIPI